MSPGPITPLEAVARRLERGAFHAEKALRNAEEKQKPRALIEQIRERVFDRRRHAQVCRDADLELAHLREKVQRQDAELLRAYCRLAIADDRPHQRGPDAA